jgi:signal transduction histidine kinase
MADIPEGVRVLAVDDEALMRRALHRAMSTAGFRVATAGDLASALTSASAAPPDLVIVGLGDLAGLELVRELRQRLTSSVHITMFSANVDDAAQRAAFEAGADDYLGKPTSAPELQRRMAVAARKQHAFVEARRAREHAEQLIAYSAEAAALLAHDLNNGLGVGLSNAEYLLEAATLADDDQQQALEAIARSLRRMAGLVANFVDISRFEDGAIQPKCADVNVAAALGEILGMHAPQARSDITLTTTCEADLVAYFDAALIERVLHNLVGNAMRYCRGGSVRVSATAWPSLDHVQGMELIVANTGPAVPDEVVGHLFSKYGRDRNGKRGMGLYFCRLACEAHGGSIALTNGDDGPAFHVQLPGRRW